MLGIDPRTRHMTGSKGVGKIVRIPQGALIKKVARQGFTIYT